MQRCFSYYFTMSNDLTKFAFRKLSVAAKIELLIYSLLSFLGKWFFFLRPIFTVADDNIASMISETHSLCMEKIFEGVPEKYWRLFVTYFVADLKALFIINLFFWPLWVTCLFFPDLLVVHIVSTVVLSVVVLAVIFSRVKYQMIGFLGAYDNNLSMGDYFYNCRKPGSGTNVHIFFNELLWLLIVKTIPVGVLVYSFRYLFFGITLFGNEWNLAVIAGLLIFCFILSTFWLNRFTLVKFTTLHLIANDACIKKKCIVAKRVASSGDRYAAVFTHNKADFEKLDISKEEN